MKSWVRAGFVLMLAGGTAVAAGVAALSTASTATSSSARPPALNGLGGVRLAARTEASPLTSYTFHTVDLPGASDSAVTGISNSNVLVGDEVVGSKEYGFIDAKGKVGRLDPPFHTGAAGVQVAGIDTHGEIVGDYISNSVIHGFTRSTSGHYDTFNVPGAGTAAHHGTTIDGLSPGGVIVGSYVTPAGAVVGFADSQGKLLRYQVDQAGQRRPTRIEFTYDGTIGGVFQDGAGVDHGFYKTAAGAFHEVTEPSASKAAGRGTVLYGMDRAGAVFGTYTSGSGAGSFSEYRGVFHLIKDPAQTATSKSSGDTLVFTVTPTAEIGGAYTYDGAGFTKGFSATPKS